MAVGLNTVDMYDISKKGGDAPGLFLLFVADVRRIYAEPSKTAPIIL